MPVCLSGDYDHTPRPIDMNFGINLLGTKTERCMCKDFFSPPVSKWRPSQLRLNALTDTHEIQILWISFIKAYNFLKLCSIWTEVVNKSNLYLDKGIVCF